MFHIPKKKNRFVTRSWARCRLCLPDAEWGRGLPSAAGRDSTDTRRSPYIQLTAVNANSTIMDHVQTGAHQRRFPCTPGNVVMTQGAIEQPSIY